MDTGSSDKIIVSSIFIDLVDQKKTISMNNPPESLRFKGKYFGQKRPPPGEGKIHLAEKQERNSAEDKKKKKSRKKIYNGQE